MFREIILDKISEAKDIVPLYAGYENCSPSHQFGPFARKAYLIHYCLSGKGILKDKYGEHSIGAGELFVIRPGEITTYMADEKNPWCYVWIAFSGNRAEIFHTNASVYACSDVVFRRIRSLVENGESSADIYTAAIYELIYQLFSGTRNEQEPLSKIERYLQYHYMKEISVEQIALLFGYERTYLYRIFKERYGVGVKEYLTRVRMENARLFLEEGNSVQVTAMMCGYSDAFAFSKAYKNYYGLAPSYDKNKN